MVNKTRKPFFERLKAGLEEGIAHAKGELTLKTVEVPEPPPILAPMQEESSPLPSGSHQPRRICCNPAPLFSKAIDDCRPTSHRSYQYFRQLATFGTEE